MALFGRKKTTVGLDIGSGLVKVAVIDHSKSTPELIKVAITKTLFACTCMETNRVAFAPSWSVTRCSA